MYMKEKLFVRLTKGYAIKSYGVWLHSSTSS